MNDWQIGIVFALGNLAPLLTWHLARTIYVNPNCAGRLLHRDINLFHAPVYIPKGVFRIGENWFCLFGRSHICIRCVLVPRPERDDDICLASVLTRWRGEVWVKELDYVYLLLGACGLAISTIV